MSFQKDPKGTAKLERRVRAKDRRRHEEREKAAVRKRDRRCRFPLCGCEKLGLALHVSHLRHKGMGGNPKGERSDRRLMLRLCASRHAGSLLSIDRQTISWQADDPDLGAEGPIAWFIRGRFLDGRLGDEWVTLAREEAPGQLEPVSDILRQVLQRLSADFLP